MKNLGQTNLPRRSMHITRWLLLALLALVLAGCDRPQQVSRFNGTLERSFKDPKARQLGIAAERGDATEVRRLMKEEHVNPDVLFSDKNDGFPILAWPILTQSPEGLRAMLENGANPNAYQPYTNERGQVRRNDNAMVYAVQNEDPTYLKLLLEHGGDPSGRYSNGENLLYKAFIWHSQWQNIQLLIEHGANINASTGDDGGQTILFDYARYADFDKVYWLLERGATPTVTVQFKNPPPNPPDPPRVLYSAVENIYWYPVDYKEGEENWQRKCQIWLMQHGYPRPPMPKYHREVREKFGYPTDEKDIPLPEPRNGS